MIHLLDEAVRKRRWTIRRAMAMAAVASASAILLLALSGWFLTGAAVAGAAGVMAVGAFNYLLPSAAVRALAIIRTLARYGERYVSHQAVMHSLADIRAGQFAAWLAAPPDALLRSDDGDLLARITGDVDALDAAVLRKAILPSGFAAGAVAVALATMAGWAAAAISLLFVGGSFGVGRWLSTKWLPAHALRVAEARGRLRHDVDELMAGSIDTHVYGLATQAGMTVEAAASSLDVARQGEARAEGMMAAVHAALSAVAIGLLASVAVAPLPLVALAVLGQLAAMEAMGSLIRLDAGRLRSAAAEQRITALTYAAVADDGVQLPSGTTLEFSLGEQSINLSQGQRLAISGPSGVGKTRLLRALVGLEHHAVGDIRIGGQPLDGMSPHQRRTAFAYAAQDAPMLAGTLADNLALARPGLSREAMRVALATACLDGLVAGLPNGFDTWLGEDGARLSGGERKRLGLARALLAGRPWLLLDEPSEGLDAATEARLVLQLNDWLVATGAGLVLVSHRPAMLALADERLVMG